MAEYRVKLDIYSGPLDLLLYLIRRNEVDIYDIPIATITEQYLEYVQVIKQIDIDLAGDFLVLAATLMEIKSALLLPREEAAEGAEEDLSDPRLELVRQLLEYKKFKDVAGRLDEYGQEQAARFPRSTADIERLREAARQEQELDLETVQIWDLFEAFNRLMKATLAGSRAQRVIYDDTPIDLYETDILDRAQKQQPLTFEAVFEGRSSRLELIGLFLALLELIRQKLVRIEQENTFGPIYIIALTEEPADKAVARAMSAELDRLPSVINRDKRTSGGAGGGSGGDHEEQPETATGAEGGPAAEGERDESTKERERDGPVEEGGGDAQPHVGQEEQGREQGQRQGREPEKATAGRAGHVSAGPEAEGV